MSSRRSGLATIGRRHHVVDGDLLAVPGVRVGQAVTGVLHLDLGEVLRRRAVQVDATAGVRARSRSGWWHRAGGTGASPGRRAAHRRSASGSPSAWCRRPTTSATSHRPARMRCRAASMAIDARRAGAVGAGDRDAGPAERLGERRTRPRSRGSRCAWCRRRRRTRRRASRCRRRPARRGPRRRRTRRSCDPTCPTGACRHPRTATCSTVITAPFDAGSRPARGRRRAATSTRRARLGRSVVLGVERVEHQLHLHADREVVDRDAGDDLAQHDELLGPSSTAAMRTGSCGSVTGTYGSGGW